MTTIALVAAKDAADSIAATVTALASVRGVTGVWVVDDGSSDGTGDRAAAAGAHVVRLDVNVGKGAALAAGVAATPQATRYLLADADLGDTAAGLWPLLAGRKAERPDLLIGVLPSARGRGGFGLVKRFARAGIRRATGFTAEAPLSGQRAVDAERLRAIVLAPRFGVEVGMTIDLVRAGGAAAEVPVDVDHKHTGRSWHGFMHRARQGRDIAAALVPRLTTVRQRILAVVVVAALVFGLLSALSNLSAAPRGAALPPAERVVLFAFDHLSLADLERSDLDALQSLRRSGVTGALSVRTSDRRTLDRRGGSERPSILDAYASLGASARVRSVPGLEDVVEDGAGARVSKIPAARSLARRDNAANLPGALGDALHAAGKRTAVVAGAQLFGTTAGFPAYAAVADRLGGVDRADLSSGLIERAAAHPLGVRSSAPAFLISGGQAMRAADVVLIDPGDMGRAVEANADETLRTIALRHTDEILGVVLGTRPANTTVIVFAPTPPGADWELTPIVIDGAQIGTGTIASSSTRRDSLGVLADLAPTVVQLLGAEAPSAMTGAVLRTTAETFDGAALRRLSTDGAVRSRFFLGAAVGYTVVAGLFYLALIGLVVRNNDERVRRALRIGACMAAAFPLALLVTGAGQHWLHRGGESPVVLVLVTCGIGATVARWRGLTPVYLLGALTVAVITLDVAVTGPIHAASLLGYSIQTSGRFYGLPNASFSVFAASVFLVAAWCAGLAPSAVRATAAAAVLVVGVAFLAAPWLGNDVGGTLALLPVAVACAWVFFGRRITLRIAIVGGVLVAAAIGAFVAAQAVFGAGTHLGRAASEGARDSSSFATTLQHRFDANVGLLIDQWWGFVCFALVLGAIYALVVQHRWNDELPERSPLRVVAIGILVASLLGFVVNDSGPVVTVLCLVVLAPALALVALEAVAKRAVAPVRK